MTLPRPLRPLLLIPVLAGLLLPALGAAPAGAKTRPGCGIKGAATMAHSSNSRIVISGSDDDDLYGGTTEVSVCHGRRGKATGVFLLESQVGDFRFWTVRGRTAAFAVSVASPACDKYFPNCQVSHAVEAFDAKTGRAIVEQRLTAPASRVVASAAGWVAWVTPGEGELQELWVARRHVTPVLVAAAADLDPASVALTSSEVWWATADGTPVGVPLP